MTIDRKHVRNIILGILAIFLLVMIYYLKSIFIPVLVSIVLAYILNPLVNFFEKRKVSRTVTIFFIYIILSLVLVFIIVVGAPYLFHQSNKLYKATFKGDKAYLKVALDRSKDWIQEWNETHPDYKVEWAYLFDTVKENIEKSFSILYSGSERFFSTASTALGSILNILSFLIFVPLYTFFFLRSLNSIRDVAYKYLPIEQEEEIKRILLRIHLAVSSFFRGKLIICITKGLLTWGIIHVIEVSFGLKVRTGLIFGIIQMIASVIPFLVLVVGMVPNIILVLVVGQTQHGGGDVSIFWLLIALITMYVVIELLEGFILTPWIMGKETGMHPVSVILTLLIGGKLAGAVGLILAIPVANTLKILAEELVLPEVREMLGRKPEPDSG